MSALPQRHQVERAPERAPARPRRPWSMQAHLAALELAAPPGLAGPDVEYQTRDDVRGTAIEWHVEGGVPLIRGHGGVAGWLADNECEHGNVPATGCSHGCDFSWAR